MMKPQDVVYEILRCYVNDQAEVDPALIAKVDGYRRSRNIAGLTSCTSHFDWAQHSIEEWRFLRQVEAFFKKNSIFTNAETCATAASASFVEAELACSATNRRLKSYVTRPHLLDASVRKYVDRMVRYISDVLGSFTCFQEELPSLVRVTPGATSTNSRRASLPQMKLMRRQLYCTSRAKRYVFALHRYFGAKDFTTRTTSTNRIELVPKNWKTDRTIACEPEGNLPLQLAFDTYAKRRLRRFGIDLSDQSRNQRMALQASIDGSFATVDFKAASDTIAFNTVSLLFPVDWFKYLWDVRTPMYRGAMGTGVYSKFSSMGNGTTFTIETLIFAAACHAVGARNYSVYGDDVIIDQEVYDDFLLLTSFLGFSINKDKSFTSGPFRESCGLDAFNGIDVTPVYIKNITPQKAVLCHLVNTLGTVMLPGGRLEAFLLSLVQTRCLPLVPFTESTMAGVWILPDIARAKKITRFKRFPMQQLTFRAYVPKHKRKRFVHQHGYYLWFFRRNDQVLFAGPWDINARGDTLHLAEECVTSSVAVYEHSYVRRRVAWYPPRMAIPDHVYLWSDLLARGLSAAGPKR